MVVLGAAAITLAAPAVAQVVDMEAAFVARIAAERLATGRSPLAVEEDLVAVARRHSAAMAAEGRLHHNSSLASQVQGWVMVGENVGTGGSVDAVHAALMASAQHRAEILGASFTGVGVGVVQAGGALWVTQVFRQREAAALPAPPPPPASPPPAPAPPPPPAAPAAPRTRAPAAPPPTAAPATTALPATTAPPPVTAPPATTAGAASAPAPGFVPATAGRAAPAVDLGSLAVAAAGPVPRRPAVVALGTVAAMLLWSVAASLARPALRRRLVPAR
ncbi:MAG TPA: CAP domain-containing protein [Acidimicrobiales bacterium]|nr:CAP domain-containing protein [Acidimicrobiales bacterium]